MMEIPGYTNEKEHIAREHLIPEADGDQRYSGRQAGDPAAALGKPSQQLYKEAGVRSLERSMDVSAKTARAIMEEGKDKVVVTSRNISRFLGKERYNYLMANEKDEIGIARGLAWTRVGGDTTPDQVISCRKRRSASYQTAWRCDEGICTGRYQLSVRFHSQYESIRNFPEALSMHVPHIGGCCSR